MKLLFSLVQVTSLCLLASHVCCRLPWFRPWREEVLSRRDKLLLYALFSAMAVAGTYLGIPVQGAIANTRALGPVLAGLTGGPWLGLAVGLTGGAHRALLSGFTATACGLATAAEGLLAGLVYLVLGRSRAREVTLRPEVACAVAAAAQFLHMGIILALARPFADALSVVKVIAFPMIAINAVGAALFMSILRERRGAAGPLGAASSEKVLRIAQRSLALLGRGFDRSVALELAHIIHEETGVAAVAVTDAESVLAFVGAGSDHHEQRGSVPSGLEGGTVAAGGSTDGRAAPFRCPTSSTCPLRSALVVPLSIDAEIIGTIRLFEDAHAPPRRLSRVLSEGLTALLAGQILRARYREQKRRTTLAEIKLAHAQINPHFLFNSLATIGAILRRNPERARALLGHLSTFFRMNLKRSSELATLEEELAHVRAYLEIARARYEGRLSVEIEVDPELLGVKLPVFTLQPLVENAIQHGVAEMMTPGTARIRAYRSDGAAVIDIEDDAGSFDQAKRRRDGLGMGLVDKRIRSMPGGSALSVTCVPQKLTRVSIRLPLGEATRRSLPGLGSPRLRLQA